MDVFPVTWSVDDGAPGDTCQVTVFGKLPDGRAACVHVDFTPFFYVEFAGSDAKGGMLIAQWAKKYEALYARSRVVRRRPMWGFRNGKDSSFVLLAFGSMAHFRRARYGLVRDGYDTYEAAVDPIVRLFHLRGIGPCKWMRVSRYSSTHPRTAHVDVEVRCGYADVGPSEVTDRPPLVFASWDIECFSASGRFPVADKPEDCLIQISTTFQRYGEPEPYDRTVVCLRDTDPVDGATVIWTDQEHEVIELWAKLLREHKTDVAIAYNCYQFDWKYIVGRMGVLVDDRTGEPLVDQELFGKALVGGGEVREFELNSGAYGQNKFFAVSTPGILQIDLLQYIRKEFKLDAYSLNAVSQKFLDNQKIDLPAHEIFAKFEKTPGDRADIVRYAIKDTELPLQLCAKLTVWENLTEMANAVSVPTNYLLDRGQQIKVYSVILGKARAMGYLIPDNKGIGLPDGAKYEGATVLEAQRGAYFDVVCGLDFASLVSRSSASHAQHALAIRHGQLGLRRLCRWSGSWLRRLCRWPV